MEKKNFVQQNSSLLPYDPIVLVVDLIRQWKIIVLLTLMIAAGAYIYSDCTYHPVYRSDATLVVTTQDSTNTVYSNLKSATELASVLTELLNSSLLQGKVLESLGMPSWHGTIQAGAIEETNLLSLHVTADDPRTAFLVACAVIENHELVTYDVVGDIVVEVLQAPRMATAPVNASTVRRDVCLLTFLGFAALCGVGALLSYRRDTVRSRKEAESKLDCWCLGEICHEPAYKTLGQWRRRERDPLTITDPATGFRFVEMIRKLQRRVEQHLSGGKVVLLTSVAGSEGKSTIAVNLALAFARKHPRVLLVDLDLRRPSCREILRRAEAPYGTADVLAGRAALADVLERDRLSGLELLLAKADTQASAASYDALLASDGVQKLLQAAREQYDYIIVDMPPISVAGDVECVVDHADAALLVIRQNMVPAKALDKAVAALKASRARLLGCVLNDVYVSHFSEEAGGLAAHDYGYGRYGRSRRSEYFGKENAGIGAAEYGEERDPERN